MAEDAAFYDKALTSKGALAMLPLPESPWLPLYKEAAGWISVNEPVVDMGCGTGRFMRLLYYRGERYGPYLGVDFSPAAIAESARQVPVSGESEIEIDFELADLEEWQPADVSGNTIFVCLEVLEHLEGDQQLIARLPPGRRFVFSVPSFNSKGHVRYFQNLSEIWARYGGLLEFRRWSLVDLGLYNAIHLLDTIRRSDSW